MEKLEEIIEEFRDHPAMRFANDAIVTEAIRSGTKGYTGEENLVDWLRQALKDYARSCVPEDKNEGDDYDDIAHGWNLARQTMLDNIDKE